MLTAGAEGHQALINTLRFHPAGPFLIGAGGGSGDGIIAFWKLDPPTTDAKPAEGAKPEDKKPEEKRPAVPAHRAKTDLHIHRLCLAQSGTELFAAGHGKLDVWTLAG